MKPATLICFSLFLTGIFLGLIQLWFQTWNVETFFKIIITNGAFFVISFVLAFLLKENKESEKINRGSSLD